jgi:hypothetical protein
MIKRVRDEAFGMMSSKCSTSKSHDSDTYSYWTKNQTAETASTHHDDAESVIASLGDKLHGLWLADEEKEEDDDGGNNGVILRGVRPRRLGVPSQKNAPSLFD